MAYPKSKINKLAAVLRVLMQEGEDPETEPLVNVYVGPRYLSDQADSPKIVLSYADTFFESTYNNDALFARSDRIWVYVFGRDSTTNNQYTADDTATDETEALVYRLIAQLATTNYFNVEGNRMIDSAEWTTHQSDTVDSWDNRGDVFRFRLAASDIIIPTPLTQVQLDQIQILQKLGETDWHTILLPPQP